MRTRRFPTQSSGPGAQATMLAFATGMAQLVLALIYISAARSTNPADYGLVIAAVALGTSAVGFVDFGTNAYWIRELARGKLSQMELSRRLTSKLLIALSLAIAWVLVVVFITPGSALWMAGPIAVSFLANQTLQVPLRGIARNDIVALNVLTDKVVAAVAFVLLGFVGVDVLSRLWLCITVGATTAAVFGWLWTPVRYRPALRLTAPTNPWRGAGHYGASSLAASAQTLDLPILAGAGGAFAAGVYGAVNRWTQPMGLLSGAFVSASLPFMARASNFKEGLTTVKKGLWLPSLAVLVCIAMITVAPLIVSLTLGEAYADSAVILQTLAVGTMLGIINQPLVVFLQARGYDRPVAWLMGCAVALQLCLVAFLGSYLGAIGAAFALISLQALLFIGSAIVTAIIWLRGE